MLDFKNQITNYQLVIYVVNYSQDKNNLDFKNQNGSEKKRLKAKFDCTSILFHTISISWCEELLQQAIFFSVNHHSLFHHTPYFVLCIQSANLCAQCKITIVCTFCTVPSIFCIFPANQPCYIIQETCIIHSTPYKRCASDMQITTVTFNSPRARRLTSKWTQ